MDHLPDFKRLTSAIPTACASLSLIRSVSDALRFSVVALSPGLVEKLPVDLSSAIEAGGRFVNELLSENGYDHTSRPSTKGRPGLRSQPNSESVLLHPQPRMRHVQMLFKLVFCSLQNLGIVLSPHSTAGFGCGLGTSRTCLDIWQVVFFEQIAHTETWYLLGYPALRKYLCISKSMKFRIKNTSSGSRASPL